jgi:hypothetical protein
VFYHWATLLDPLTSLFYRPLLVTYNRVQYTTGAQKLMWNE